MSLLSRLFGARYNDDKLASLAYTAISTDPLLSDVTGVTVSSESGVIKLTGVVHKITEKERIEGDIKNALGVAGIKHDRIINALNVG